MDNNKQLRLAEYLQDKLHSCFLPGFYFDVEDVYDIIDEFNEKEESGEVE